MRLSTSAYYTDNSRTCKLLRCLRNKVDSGVSTAPVRSPRGSSATVLCTAPSQRISCQLWNQLSAKKAETIRCARTIRTFLEQMASGGGFSFGAAVMKALVQNADAAGATELAVALDDRKGGRVLKECQPYGPLFEPALLIRNDKPFRLAEEVEAGDQDDFRTICDVAGGHKRLNPTGCWTAGNWRISPLG